MHHSSEEERSKRMSAYGGNDSVDSSNTGINQNKQPTYDTQHPTPQDSQQ